MAYKKQDEEGLKAGLGIGIASVTFCSSKARYKASQNIREKKKVLLPDISSSMCSGRGKELVVVILGD